MPRTANRGPMEALVFDMDGTVLHTLPDLVAAANEAFGVLGYPARTEAEALTCMGCGGKHMVQKLMPQGCSREEQERAFELWRDIYIASEYSLTRPYPGITDALCTLHERGVKTAILSNKFDAGVHLLSDRFFEGLFDMVRGEIEPAPRKPDPTVLLSMLDELNVRPDKTAYVGDTIVDYEVARNAGVAAVGVSWGYDKAQPLPISDLDYYIHDPAELLDLA